MKKLIFALSLVFFTTATFAQGGGLPYKQMEKYKGNNMLLTDPVTGQSMIVPFEDHHQIDTFDIVGDTLRISLKGDSVAYKFVILPKASSAEGTVKGTGAANRVAFWVSGDSLSSDDNLYWDNTEKRLGLGLTNPAQQLEMTGNLRMASPIAGALNGIIYKGTTPFIHDFNYGNNNTVTTQGRNTHVGVNSGNLTSGATATQTYHASNNVGVGYNSLYSNSIGFRNIAYGSNVLFNNTEGYQNMAIGFQAMSTNTTGYNNSAIGYNSLFYNVSGSANMGIGTSSLFNNTTGVGNAAIGVNSLYSNVDGIYNVGIGHEVLYGNTTGTYNIGIGYRAGRYIAAGSTANTTSDYSIYIGRNTKASADNAQKEIVIGDEAVGSGSNTITFGGATTLKTHIPYGGLRLSGLSTSTETTAVMIDSNKDLSYRTLNAAAFNGTIDSTALTGGYGIDVSEASNNWTVKADTSEVTTPYGVSQMISDSLALLSFEDTQDLSIDSTGRVFTISLTDGGSVSFQDTDTNTTYLAGTGLSLTGTTFANTSPMVYPGAGIPLSTGSAWGTSITNNSANWNTAFGWGNHAGLYPPLGRTLTINGTTQDLSANRTWSVGTVTSVATGNGITGGTITSTGTLGLTGQALALHNLSSSGMIARTGAGTVAARTITAGTGISVSNGDGVSGNPTITNTGVTSFNGSTGAITYSGLTGSGTATHIPYFSGTSTLASSANMTFATSGSMTITGGSSPFIGGLNLLGSTGSIITMQQSNAQYNLTYGYDLQSQPFYGFYPGNTGFAQSLEIRTYQMYKRFEFNPNSGWMKLYKLTGSTPTQTIELDGQNQKIKLGSTYGATGQAIIVDAAGAAVWGTPASTPSEPSPSATKRYNMSEQTISSSSYDYVTLSSSAFTNSFITWSSANNAFQIAYPTGTSYYEINVNANIKGGSSTGAAAYFRIIKMNSSNDHEQIEKIHQYPTSQAWQNININTIMAFSQNQLVRIEAKSVTGQSFIIDNIDVTIKRVY